MKPGDTVFYNKIKMTIREIDDDGVTVCEWKDKKGNMRADLFREEDLSETAKQMDRSDFSLRTF